MQIVGNPKVKLIKWCLGLRPLSLPVIMAETNISFLDKMQQRIQGGIWGLKTP